jgi:uncharacterized membrane protein YbaN (DUF454 family)
VTGGPSLGRKVAGFSLLGLGLLGTVLPFLQGFLFLALGLFVLRDQYPWARRSMAWLHRRWPRQVDGVEALEARLVNWSRRQGDRLRHLLARR